MTKKQSYKERIWQLLRKSGSLTKTPKGFGVVPFTEQKYGGAFVDSKTGYEGEFGKGYTKRKDEVLDKKVKKITDDLVNKIFKKGVLAESKETFKELVHRIIMLHYHRKRLLPGVKLEVSIMAITYNILTTRLIQLTNILLYLVSKEIEQRDYSLIKKLIREYSQALKILEKQPDFYKCKRKFEKIHQKKYGGKHYNIKKIDKFDMKWKEKGFSDLFKLDIKKLPGEYTKPLGLPSMVRKALSKSLQLARFKREKKENEKREYEKGKNEYSQKIGVEGFFLALQIIEGFEPKKRNKVRKGLFGACSYLIAKLNYIDSFWIAPEKPIAWARFYNNMDREVFQKRIKEVISSLGWKKYVLIRINKTIFF